MSLTIPSHLSLIPGDPAGIQHTADRFAATAKAINEAISELKGAILEAKCGDAESIDAVAEVAEESSARLLKLEDRYDNASTHLATFSIDLQSAQDQAASLVTQRDQWTEYLSGLQNRQNAHADAAPQIGSEGYIERLIEHRRESAGYRTSINSANEQLRQLQLQYSRVVTELNQAATRTSRAFSDALKSDGLNDSGWDRFTNWVSEHAEVIAKIHEIMGYIAAGLAVLSFIFPVLAPFAAIAAGVTALLSMTLALAGEKSWVEFGLDLLAVATLGVGALLGATMKGVMGALKGMRIARVAAAGGSKSPTRVVNGSFNGALQSTKGAKVAGVQLPTPGWACELVLAGGRENAHFLRIANNANAAGASGPLDALLINMGQQTVRQSQIATALGNLSLLDSTAGSLVPALREASGNFFEADISRGDVCEKDSTFFLFDLWDGYQEVKELSTWKVGG